MKKIAPEWETVASCGRGKSRVCLALSEKLTPFPTTKSNHRVYLGLHSVRRHHCVNAHVHQPLPLSILILLLAESASAAIPFPLHCQAVSLS